MLCPLDQNPLPVLVRKKGLESVSMRVWPAVRSVITEDGYVWGEEDAGHASQSAVVRTGESDFCWCSISEDAAWG